MTWGPLGAARGSSFSEGPHLETQPQLGHHPYCTLYPTLTVNTWMRTWARYKRLGARIINIFTHKLMKETVHNWLHAAEVSQGLYLIRLNHASPLFRSQRNRHECSSSVSLPKHLIDKFLGDKKSSINEIHQLVLPVCLGKMLRLVQRAGEAPPAS